MDQKNHLVETTHWGSLDTTLPWRAINVNRDVWNNNTIEDNKIPSMVLVDVNKPRPRSPFAVQKTNIRCDIEASTQSLD